MAKYDISAAFRREAERLGRVSTESERARRRAVGTLARRLPVEARRDMGREYNLPAGRISQGTFVSQGDGYVELRGIKRGIGMVNFGARWGGVKSQGVTVQILRGKRELWPDLFIAGGNSGNRQVFGRISSKRLPIRAYYGPSVAQMLRKPGRAERLAEFAQVILRAEFERLRVSR